MSESAWIAACVKGDEQALSILFEENRDWLFAICRRYLPSKEEAEDALQESFILIFKNIASYNGHGSFKGWLRKITVNCALGMLRKRKLQNFRPLEYDISPVDLSFLQKLDLEELQHIIDKLSPGRRQIFIAHAIDGLTHKEIAKQLKISEGTSKSQFFDARKEIKWALENNVMIAKRKV